MRARSKALIWVGLLVAVAAAALIVAGVGSDPAPAAASGEAGYDLATPAMEPIRQAPPRTAARSPRLRRPPPKPRRPRKPVITDLITTDPVTVEANGSRVAVLACGKSQGIALDGGAITPAAPAQVLVSTLSRANPNPPFANSPKLYYVGVRNLDPVPTTFRATLVCAKGIKIK